MSHLTKVGYMLTVVLQGTDCQVDLNTCRSSPCHNGGTCINGDNGFTCACPIGFQMDFDCLSDVDECEQGRCNAATYISCTV